MSIGIGNLKCKGKTEFKGYLEEDVGLREGGSTARLAKKHIALSCFVVVIPIPLQFIVRMKARMDEPWSKFSSNNEFTSPNLEQPRCNDSCFVDMKSFESHVVCSLSKAMLKFNSVRLESPLFTIKVSSRYHICKE